MDVFALDAHGGALERLPRRRDERAAVVVVARRDEIFFILAQHDGAHREDFWDDHLTHVEHRALGAVAVGAQGNFLTVAREARARRGAFGGARCAAEAELHGVGAAHEAEALGVVGVGLDGGAKIIPRLVDVAEAAGISRVVGDVARAGARIAVAVHVVVIGLRGRRKEKRLVGRGRTDVVEKILREDLHLPRDIGEIDLAAATLEHGGGHVAALGVGADLEG